MNPSPASAAFDAFYGLELLHQSFDQGVLREQVWIRDEVVRGLSNEASFLCPLRTR